MRFEFGKSKSENSGNTYATKYLEIEWQWYAWRFFYFVKRRRDVELQFSCLWISYIDYLH